MLGEKKEEKCESYEKHLFISDVAGNTRGTFLNINGSWKLKATSPKPLYRSKRIDFYNLLYKTSQVVDAV